MLKYTATSNISQGLHSGLLHSGQFNIFSSIINFALRSQYMLRESISSSMFPNNEMASALISLRISQVFLDSQPCQ